MRFGGAFLVVDYSDSVLINIKIIEKSFLFSRWVKSLPVTDEERLLYYFNIEIDSEEGGSTKTLKCFKQTKFNCFKV